MCKIKIEIRFESKREANAGIRAKSLFFIFMDKYIDSHFYKVLY